MYRKYTSNRLLIRDSSIHHGMNDFAALRGGIFLGPGSICFVVEHLYTAIIGYDVHKDRVRNMKEDLNYFGVPEENINAARRRPPTGRSSAYTVVPSRREIATLPLDKLKDVLLGWVEHGATEIIPSRAQISLVKEVLLSRADVPQLGPS